MKLILTTILEYDENMWHGDDKDATEWFFDILKGDQLTLFDEMTGDFIGPIKVVHYERPLPESGPVWQW